MFATLEDLEKRRGELSADETEKAATLLEDAAAYLYALVDVDPNNAEQAELLKIVSCNMVIRALDAGGDMYGVESASMTAGVYSETRQFANPAGDMYLTKMEKRLLGVTTSYIGSIRPMIGEHDD